MCLSGVRITGLPAASQANPLTTRELARLHGLAGQAAGGFITALTSRKSSSPSSPHSRPLPDCM